MNGASTAAEVTCKLCFVSFEMKPKGSWDRKITFKNATTIPFWITRAAAIFHKSFQLFPTNFNAIIKREKSD